MAGLPYKNKQSIRREIHKAINNLSHESVAEVVKKHFPRISPLKIDAAAKMVIAKAHDLVSPKRK